MEFLPCAAALGKGIEFYLGCSTLGPQVVGYHVPQNIHQCLPFRFYYRYFASSYCALDIRPNGFQAFLQKANVNMPI